MGCLGKTWLRAKSWLHFAPAKEWLAVGPVHLDLGRVSAGGAGGGGSE
jgi:hypothetical protein